MFSPLISKKRHKKTALCGSEINILLYKKTAASSHGNSI